MFDRGFPALAGMDLAAPTAADPHRRLPRARGDGPDFADSLIGSVRASPRSRGWTRDHRGRIRPAGGFPALAGMDPGATGEALQGLRLPRARGDGPCPVMMKKNPTMASPRSRGWTPARRTPGKERCGFPALAGMDHEFWRLQRAGDGLPRARGDGPVERFVSGWMAAASPRSRGWTPKAPPYPHRRLGFPALAGMDLVPNPASDAPIGLPRARGDGPLTASGPALGLEASPRSRGWTRIHRRRRTGGRGFPALAGMDPRGEAPDGLLSGLPRARGDGPARGAAVHVAGMASPRSRGWTARPRGAAGASGGFPALAGMDPARQAERRAKRRLPRARGDGPRSLRDARRRGRASPRSRGWTPYYGIVRRLPCGFPALAGMDPRTLGCGLAAPRLPRARGDGPPAMRTSSPSAEASPRSRGWTWRAAGRGLTGTGFPALAGMDPNLAALRRFGARLPRARGDGPCGVAAAAGGNAASLVMAR